MDLPPIYGPKEAALFSISFCIPPPLLASLRATEVGRQANEWVKCGFRCPLPDRDAHFEKLCMVGLGLKPTTVSADNTLGRASKRGWMGISGCKAPSQLDSESFPRFTTLCMGPKGCGRGKQEPVTD